LVEVSREADALSLRDGVGDPQSEREPTLLAHVQQATAHVAVEVTDFGGFRWIELDADSRPGASVTSGAPPSDGPVDGDARSVLEDHLHRNTVSHAGGIVTRDEQPARAERWIVELEKVGAVEQGQPQAVQGPLLASPRRASARRGWHGPEDRRRREVCL